jgi:hypothetical protein
VIWSRRNACVVAYNEIKNRDDGAERKTRSWEELATLTQIFWKPELACHWQTLANWTEAANDLNTTGLAEDWSCDVSLNKRKISNSPIEGLVRMKPAVANSVTLSTTSFINHHTRCLSISSRKKASAADCHQKSRALLSMFQTAPKISSGNVIFGYARMKMENCATGLSSRGTVIWRSAETAFRMIYIPDTEIFRSALWFWDFRKD